jgi:aspartate kinase
MIKKSLRVMKFGGTSVGDASCIGRVVEIIRAASRESCVAVVVSAMSGVTNQLIAAANEAKASAVAEIFARLSKQHHDVVEALIHSAAARKCTQGRLQDLLAEGERLCQETRLNAELTARALDAISGLGERLCAPLVAAALAEIGVASEAINATELVVTDAYHGGAEPRTDLTRARCQTRLGPLLRKGIVPVATGFIGATQEGVLTTLGRGGSDYSATILGAALDADAVVIWSDVSGLLTADPRLVAEACTITEISYREAAELAYFGAKVLHPKTLRPVIQRGIPLWVKNTFAPEDPGTRISPAGPSNSVGVRALTAISDAALIAVTGAFTGGVADVLARTVATAAAVRADVLLISQSSENDIRLVVPSAVAQTTVAALRREFAPEWMHKKVEYSVCDSAVSVVTLVGHGMRRSCGNIARALAALEQENVEVIAQAQSSDCSLSFVVSQPDVRIALASIHRALELSSMPSNRRPVTPAADSSGAWKYQSEPASAD